MTHYTQLEDNLGGDDNFRAWKYKISLILEENDLDQFIITQVLELESDEAMTDHKKSMSKSKRIIADSIKDHLIPHVYAFKTPKEVDDVFKNIFKGKNINQKMTLRNQLKNVNI